MGRENLADLNAFLVVAEQGSFTRAAVILETSQSTLSHTIRRVEKRLGLRLLTRTTRSITPTAAGERLLATLRPALASIGAELDALAELRERPAGTIRITTAYRPAITLLQPALARLLPDYPDITVEIVVDHGLTDIVAERFDAGIRTGDLVAKDMIAMRIGPDITMAVVASPSYFSRHPRPKTPQDLTAHNCITVRATTTASAVPWRFRKRGRELNVRVEGQIIVNNLPLRLNAALAGMGLAYLDQAEVQHYLASGELVSVLADWCPERTGYHIYYPSRQYPSAAFSLLIRALRSGG